MAISRFLPLFLGARDHLDDRDREALATIPVRREQFSHGDKIITAGPTPGESCLLISGMALRVHDIGKQRVVSALQVPGDFLDLHSFLLATLDHDVVAQGDCAVEFVRSEELTRITEERPHLTRLLWLCTLIDAKVTRVWTAAAASLKAHERIGHFLCELHARLGIVGLIRDDSFNMPIEQKDLADILGFSVAHTNRALQDLRGRGLVTWNKGRVHLPDPDALAALCSFDSRYLETISAAR